MTARKQTFSVKDIEWKKREVLRTRRVKRKDESVDGYVHKEAAAYTHSVFVGDFEVTVDVPAIIDMMIGRAVYNRTGKGKMLNGLATVKRTRRLIKSTTVQEIPLADRDVEVKL